MSSTIKEALNGPSITMALQDFMQKEASNLTDHLQFE
jgi:hypothetical protein